MSLFSYKYVFRFEFSIDYPLAVEQTETNNYFCCNFCDGALGEGHLTLLMVVIEVSHRQILHDYIDFGFILKGFLDVDEETFVLDVLNAVTLQQIKLLDLAFFDYLHSVSLVVGLLLY